MEEFKVSEEGTVSLVIKTPSQVHGDQLIHDVNINWTVKELKSHLARVHPSKPTEKDQRLIYSGKLLPDHLNIKEVFRTVDVVPTLHLVCSFRTQPGPQLDATTKVGASPVQQCPEAGAQVPSVPTVSSATGLRHRGHPTSDSTPDPAPATPTMTTPGPVPAAMTQPTFPAYSLYSPQQLMWLQHMYARQYYMQYHAAMAATAASSWSPASSAASPLPVAPPHAAAAAPTPAVALPNQAPLDPNGPAPAPGPALMAAQGANGNLGVNAGGGPVVQEQQEEQEEAPWDWLDWVYTASRLAVLLNIVYFYSNPSRFLLVMCILFVMHLHAVGWFPFRNRARVRHQNQPELAQNQHNQNQERQPEQVAPPAEAEVGQVEGESESQQASMTAVPVPQVRPHLLWTAWGFFKAFFASLIPEAPQAVVN